MKGPREREQPAEAAGCRPSLKKQAVKDIASGNLLVPNAGGRLQGHGRSTGSRSARPAGSSAAARHAAAGQYGRATGGLPKGSSAPDKGRHGDRSGISIVISGSLMPPPYKRVGRCIYCPATVYSEDDPTRKLGDEHIIPLQIRGTVVLPEASCKACEAITSGLESKIAPLYSPGKYHLGIRGRKSRKERASLPFQDEHGRTQEKIESPAIPVRYLAFNMIFWEFCWAWNLATK